MKNAKYLTLLITALLLIACAPEIEEETSFVKNEVYTDEEMAEENFFEDVDIEEDKDVSSSDSDYGSSMSNLMFMLSEYIMDFNLLNEEVYLDSNVLNDDAWNTEMESTMIDIKDITDEVRNIDVPEEYVDEHNVVIKGMDEFETAIDSYINAIDTLDYHIIDQMNSSFKKGSEYVDQYVKMIEE